jgi:hypothetical protein
MPGDVVFILGGTLPILYLSVLGIRYMKKGSTTDGPQDVLFTDVATQSENRQMLPRVSSEFILTLGYAVGLAVIAMLLELAARHFSRSSC